MTQSKKASEANAEVARVSQARAEKLRQLPGVIAKIDSLLQKNKELAKQLAVLDSVSLGLYEEIDKLSKKAPAEPVSELVVEQVNDLVRETKQLIVLDTYVQRLKEFVSAGDNPQHRDVVIVLRQIRQGLERYRSELRDKASTLSISRHEANGIEFALRSYMENGRNVSEEHLQRYQFDLPKRWLTEGDFQKDRHFDFSELDKINIVEYFARVED